MTQLSQFIINHWLLVAAFISVGALIILNELYAQKKQAPKITSQRLVQLMNHNNIPVYDLRAVDIYRKGHIVNAQRIQAEDFDKDAQQALKQKPFVLVCESGQQAPNLANALKKKGFEQVTVLQGGMRAWLEADLPLIKGK